MSAPSFFEDRVLFAAHMPAQINALLQSAVASYASDRAGSEALLWQAQRENPACLQTYFALYKFYFYDARFIEAERAAFMALEQAAQQGVFFSDWRRLDRSSLQCRQERYPEAVQFYLYSLKALTFIHLRQGRLNEARAILSRLRELDPHDQSGASVIMDLAAGLEQRHG